MSFLFTNLVRYRRSNIGVRKFRGGKTTKNEVNIVGTYANNWFGNVIMCRISDFYSSIRKTTKKFGQDNYRFSYAGPKKYLHTTWFHFDTRYTTCIIEVYHRIIRTNDVHVRITKNISIGGRNWKSTRTNSSQNDELVQRWIINTLNESLVAYELVGKKVLLRGCDRRRVQRGKLKSLTIHSTRQ